MRTALLLLLGLALLATASAPVQAVNACVGASDAGASVCLATSSPEAEQACLAASYTTPDASGSTHWCAGA